MSQQELLKRVVARLNAAGVDYMLTGSMASSLQGEPRASHDVDLVVNMTPAGVASLLAEFVPPRFHLDEASIREAMRRGDMFNLLDADTGDKVDFWMLTANEFDQSRFARKVLEETAGLRIKVSTPEDTILMKLKWAVDSGGSEKQFQDARSVYEVQFTNLDQSHLDKWAQVLGVVEELARLRREVPEP